MGILEEAKKVFDKEIKALEMTRDSLDHTFEQILKQIISCKGKTIMTGMGKSGHIAKKIAATLSSLGTASFYLNPADAMHGDLGMVEAADIVIMISYSGESEEILKIIPNVKLIGATIIAITGNISSSLAGYADVVQILPQFEEACHLGLAPTSSTTAVLCYGDALAVVASEMHGFKDADFGKYHPAGTLGKKLLLKVDDVMYTEEKNAVINEEVQLTEAIYLLSYKKLGIVNIVDFEGRLAGVITTGDLGRQLEKRANIYKLSVKDVMTCNPITVEKGKLAVEALNIMKTHNIYSLPVLENGKPIGTVNMQGIIQQGIV